MKRARSSRKEDLLCREKEVIRAKILSNKAEGEDHYVMELESFFLGGRAKPGQFVNVKAGGETMDPLLRIPLGIHSISSTGIKLLYKVVGVGTRLIARKKKGETLDLVGPLGNGFDLGWTAREKGCTALVVSGGHGIAPLFALTEEFQKKKVKSRFFIGARTKGHVVCGDRIKKLGVTTEISTEDGTMGEKGYVTRLVAKYIGKKQKEQEMKIFACGPRPMLAACAEIADKYEIEMQASLDAYMACGIGICLGCAVPAVDGYRMACSDGPVFDSREIKWKELADEI